MESKSHLDPSSPLASHVATLISWHSWESPNMKQMSTLSTIYNMFQCRFCPLLSEFQNNFRNDGFLKWGFPKLSKICCIVVLNTMKPSNAGSNILKSCFGMSIFQNSMEPSTWNNLPQSPIVKLRHHDAGVIHITYYRIYIRTSHLIPIGIDGWC